MVYDAQSEETLRLQRLERTCSIDANLALHLLEDRKSYSSDLYNPRSSPLCIF